MEIKVSAFGNFSTDTGSTEVRTVNMSTNVFTFRRSRPSVPHGANFYYYYYYYYYIIIIIIIVLECVLR